MEAFFPALWAEALKARRSKVPLLTALGFTLAPLMGGLFMYIMKNPERAREMGLLNAKAQLMMSTAEWATFFSVLTQAIAIGGLILFAIVTSWVFGREFTDRTAKDLLSLPASREAIVAAKFVVVAGWVLLATLLIFGIGLLVGTLLGLPGWSQGLVRESFLGAVVTAILTLCLMPPVAFFAIAGRGYLPPLGWTVLTIFLAQILAALGWGGWFPWSVPALVSGMAGPGSAEQLGIFSYFAVLLVSATGLLATFYWWSNTDQG